MGLVVISFVALPALVTSCEDPETKVPQYTGVTLGGYIMIYAEVGTDFETAKAFAEGAITDAYNNTAGDLKDRVDVIYVDDTVAGLGIAGSGYTYADENGKKVLRIATSNSFIASVFGGINSDLIELAQSKQNNNIHLAEFDNSKETVCLAMDKISNQKAI